MLAILLVAGASASACAGQASPYALPSIQPVTSLDANVNPPGTALLMDQPVRQLTLLAQSPAVGRRDVLVRVSLDPDGIPRSVQLAASCGEQLLDRAVLSAVRSFRFAAPDRKDDVANGFLLVHAGT